MQRAVVVSVPMCLGGKGEEGKSISFPTPRVMLIISHPVLILIEDY